MNNHKLPLKLPLPSNRSYEELLNHFMVEKHLAQKLRTATRAMRTKIYLTMYDELFSKVPDHPRLKRRKSKDLTERAIKDKYLLLKPFIRKNMIIGEFAPGDCMFINHCSSLVNKSYGIDISDQREPMTESPENFEFIIYDGYNLSRIPDNSIDLFFSDQLIEHFHPEDTELHFKLVISKLKDGGKYIFRTPHGLTGPHDISKYFSDVPVGFHLKEWTHTELKKLVMDLGCSNYITYRRIKGYQIKVPFLYFAINEFLFSTLMKNCKLLKNKALGSIISVLVK
ncbi:MAG: class I SAM-dependent methyltransferase [Ignavibacteriales bacterium]|nr:class I SAM-dependent methyltransferase [Ignavibacteriales bacterium]MCF8435869.1 class I SAM-dependent methyltransferase [Ignavibacteriales bacterium]